ncbi:MAG: hypothetical protein V3U37_02010 [Nitrospinaceae bacterium]
MTLSMASNELISSKNRFYTKDHAVSPLIIEEPESVEFFIFSIKILDRCFSPPSVSLSANQLIHCKIRGFPENGFRSLIGTGIAIKTGRTNEMNEAETFPSEEKQEVLSENQNPQDGGEKNHEEEYEQEIQRNFFPGDREGD